ncbi:MAG: hemerythrin domain-containing protein [Candidatus Dormibacteria bacterium]
MPDICDLILDDHETFRRRYAELDEHRDDTDALARVWMPLAELLDVHAAAEETVFYPELLRRAADADDETVDAIKDHNKIRDAVAAAAAEAVGSDGWWKAVQNGRKENGDHMAEEEREGLADFRAEVGADIRDQLGARFIAFKEAHAGRRSLVVEDKDPTQYVADHQG